MDIDQQPWLLPLLLLIAGALASALTVLLKSYLDARAKRAEQRYQDRKEEDAADERKAEKNVATEQSSLELAGQRIERYTTRLEVAYDQLLARLEASDELVRKLRGEVVTLKDVVTELNAQITKLIGQAAPVVITEPTLIVPASPEMPASSPEVPVQTAAEKREAEVGKNPGLGGANARPKEGEREGN